MTETQENLKNRVTKLEALAEMFSSEFKDIKRVLESIDQHVKESIAYRQEVESLKVAQAKQEKSFKEHIEEDDKFHDWVKRLGYGAIAVGGFLMWYLK